MQEVLRNLVKRYVAAMIRDAKTEEGLTEENFKVSFKFLSKWKLISPYIFFILLKELKVHKVMFCLHLLPMNSWCDSGVGLYTDTCWCECSIAQKL